MLNFDAVIVLANLMDRNGCLNHESQARAIECVKIFNGFSIKNIITCGWAYRDDSEIKIADAIKSYITADLGVSLNSVITELNSRDTVGDAYFTKVNMAIPLNWNNIWVVTSDYHVHRTNEIFNFVYGENFNITVTGAPSRAEQITLEQEIKSLEAFRTTFHGVKAGDDVTILSKMMDSHPFYNGQVYEKI